jgi:hypothetical protein
LAEVAGRDLLASNCARIWQWEKAQRTSQQGMERELKEYVRTLVASSLKTSRDSAQLMMFRNELQKKEVKKGPCSAN